MTNSMDWPAEFARVISCNACTTATHAKLLHDTDENVPQPGYVGQNYWRKRVLLIGQNPGTPKTLAEADKPYTRALRTLRDQPVGKNYEALSTVLERFIPSWPVHGNYFPLRESDLSLTEIAYFNLVRCRTVQDAATGTGLVQNCMTNHLGRWLDLLAPKVVIFIGKWAADRAAPEVARRGIPFDFMNRQRSLSSEERVANRHAVVRLVRSGDAKPSR